MSSRATAENPSPSLSRKVLSFSTEVACTPSEAFALIEKIGGQNGWFYGDWLWELRGFLDLLVGGVGLARGRRHADKLGPDHVVDCWRVEAYQPDRLLRLMGEMRLPGRGWLQFELERNSVGTVIRQSAIFEPHGLLGFLYWYGLWPVHRVLLPGMLDNIAKALRDLRGGGSAPLA